MLKNANEYRQMSAGSDNFSHSIWSLSRQFYVKNLKKKSKLFMKVHLHESPSVDSTRAENQSMLEPALKTLKMKLYKLFSRKRIRERLVVTTL